MNRLQLRTRVLMYLRNRPGYDTLINDLLNERMNSLAMPFMFPHLDLKEEVVTVADTAEVAVPAEFYVVQGVVNLTGWHGQQYKLAFIELDEYDTLPNTRNGIPSKWVQDGQEILFWLKPDAEYTMRLRGKRLPAQMSDDTHEPELPSDWHPLIAKLTASELHFLLGEDERGQALKNEALGEIATRQEVRTMQRSGEPGQVQVRRKMSYRRGHNGPLA